VIDPKQLLADLQKQVKALEADLKTNEDDLAKLRIEWEHDRVTQVAVAWVLATVFARFCEDNGLIGDAFIAGPGERTAQARERQAAYFQVEANQHKTDRAWLDAAFDEMRKSPVARGLFAEHNPMWSITPSQYATKALIDFWRKVDADGGVVHDFTDPQWNTRFLGDLYQDLSEAARKTYALLQTPEFVEEFILKYTLDPAIEEFGLEPAPPYGHDELPRLLRVIDPACGSGHFLLGAFQRILKAWEDDRPGADRRELAANALRSVHGVDKNPFAVAIARFRLLIAAMKVADVTRLDERVEFPRLNIAVGDSLLHGRGAPGQGRLDFNYTTEDVDDFFASPVEILSSGTYHVVVGNPPYITVKDKYENQNYRAYKSCSGTYALSVPFAERMFQLSVRGAVDGVGAGYVGQITANSFMKNSFGKKLVNEYFPNVEITYVIDTSGAFIPGHGTPTVILIGRRRFARSDATIRVVLGVQGEQGEPSAPENGKVWQAITRQISDPGSESEWISVADLPRTQFARHPWTLSGGGATSVIEVLSRSQAVLRNHISPPIGRAVRVGADDAYQRPNRPSIRTMASSGALWKFMTGGTVRDWSAVPEELIWFPYDSTLDISSFKQELWPWRVTLAERKTFQGTMADSGRQWWEYMQFTASAYAQPLSITFAFVATHSHFALDYGGKVVFNRHSPLIKLPDGASEKDHVALLGVLNSSAACFWLKQVSHDKGGQGINEGFKSQAWERFYQFNGAEVERLPLPGRLPLERGCELDSLARRLTAWEPSAVGAASVPTRERLDAARAAHEFIHGRMIALQEELDWDVYHRYGLLADKEAAELMGDLPSVPELRLGERAFEIVLARRMRDAAFATQWFERHRSEPVTEVPAHWPDEYKAVVERRIEIIQENRNIALIEQPEYKRRWLSDPWKDKEGKALTNWLLDRCEDRELWFVDGQPVPMTVNVLADRLHEKDADVVSVARLLKNDPDAVLAKVLGEIIADEHVPYLAKLRYKAEGMVKRQQWERTWDLQREEDATGKKLDIPVPPKYKNTDFQRPSYWRNRGKLDVPKERFISYASASPDSDSSLLLGWAGWDHREQALALYKLIDERQDVDGWGTDKVTPLIRGLAEVMPWVRQWHNVDEQGYGQSPAEALDGYLTSQRERHGITD
jgi:hypothetical protein